MFLSSIFLMIFKIIYHTKNSYFVHQNILFLVIIFKYVIVTSFFISQLLFCIFYWIGQSISYLTKLQKFHGGLGREKCTSFTPQQIFNFLKYYKSLKIK